MRLKLLIFFFGVASGVALSGIVDKIFFPQTAINQEVKKIKNSSGTSLDLKVSRPQGRSTVGGESDTLTRRERRRLKKNLRTGK